MSVMRIGGIASGLDTDDIVRQMMRPHQIRVDRLEQERQTYEWKRDQFRDITNDVRSFRDKYFDVLRPQTNLTSRMALQKMQAESDNESLVTVTAGSNAMRGTTKFEVIQSATAARAAGDYNLTGDAETSLEHSMTMKEVIEEVEGEIDFDEDGKFAFELNGTEIVIDEDETLGEVIQRINYSGAGVQAHYSSYTDRFTLQADDTGEGYITADEKGEELFSVFGISASEAGGENNGTLYNLGESGRDAEFKLDDIDETFSESSNSFTIDGITYNINENIVEGEGKSGEPVTITTSVDVDGIYETLEKFVEDYNELIEHINGKLLEERYRDFPPLTDEQKDQMRESEIEKWQEKAQSGLLRRDPELESFLRDMRGALYDTVGDLHLSEIGIETSSDYRDRGKLVLKREGEDLRKAIETNPDKVAELFTRRSEISYSADLSAEDRQQRFEESGLAHRLSDVLSDNVRTTRNTHGRKGTFLERAGIEGDLTEIQNHYNRQILEVESRINQMLERLNRREEQYYQQFISMEKALQELYAQGDWLQQHLMGGQQ